MSPIDDYFDAIFCINLDRSPDRWQHACEQASAHGITTMRRFRGIDFKDYQHLPPNLSKGMENAMYGCTSSHGALLSHISASKWERVLVLEDDFEVLPEYASDFQSRFVEAMKHVPESWDLLYLGAHHADHPFIEKVNPFCWRVNEIKTTSSYAITRKHARFVGPLMCGGSPPDDILSGFNPHCEAYCISPRLMGQYECKSVIWDREGVTCRSHSMRDPHREIEWEQQQKEKP